MDQGFFFAGRGGGFQKSSLLEIWRGRGGGRKRIFFRGAKDFFYREGGEEREDPEKKDPMVKQLFFPFSPRASQFPQRHRAGVSRLTEGTPGGWGREKKPLGRRVFFLGWGGVR